MTMYTVRPTSIAHSSKSRCRTNSVVAGRSDVNQGRPPRRIGMLTGDHESKGEAEKSSREELP